MQIGNVDLTYNKLRHFGRHFYWYRFARRLKREDLLNRAFDANFGTDTSAEVPLASAGVDAVQAADGNNTYRAIWTGEFEHAIKLLPITPAEYSFIDYGSGKGKALLLATRYPFRRIIGVEYAIDLHRISVRNWAVFHATQTGLPPVEHVYGDAAEYRPPEGNLVCFMFNPFGADTMRAVLSKLFEAHQQDGRQVYLVYVNPRNVRERDDVLTHLPAWQMVHRSKRIAICRLPACNEGAQIPRQ